MWKSCYQTNSNGLFKLMRIRLTGTIKIKDELDGYIYVSKFSIISRDLIVFH